MALQTGRSGLGARKQRNCCFLHQDQNFGLVLLQVPVEISGNSLLQRHLQNTLYMVVFVIIYGILFLLTTLYDGIWQYPTVSRCLNEAYPTYAVRKKLLDTLFRSTPSRHLQKAVSRRLPAFELLLPFSSRRGSLVPLRKVREPNPHREERK